MPYSNPTSPVPSPVKETVVHGHNSWLHHYYDQDPYRDRKSVLHTPMPIPRRSSSGQRMPNGRTRSPAASRTSSYSNHAGPSSAANAENVSGPSTPVDGLPSRRSASTPPASTPKTALGVTGLPSRPELQADTTTSESTGLGLKLEPSPEKPIPGLTRTLKDSMDSTSTIESSLPPTPADEPRSLPISSSPEGSPTKVASIKKEEDDKENAIATIPFPPFEPPPSHRTIHLSSPRTFSDTPSRPTMMGRRGSHNGQRTVSAHASSLSIDLPSSSSNNGRGQSLEPPARPSSMIRKKSGEVVKPSLKVRSMSTPDLSRQPEEEHDDPSDHEGGRPFGEERSKSVRFAGDDDDEPGTLENVITFLKEQRPVQLGQENMTETETENDTDASDFVQFRTRRNAAARAIDEAERIVMEGGSRVPRIRVDFSPDARSVLGSEHVVLERVDMATPGPLALKGTAVVRNVSFNKWVAVRFTLDHWQTVSEVSANHVCHIPSSTTGDEGWDRFSFSIKLDDYKRKLEERQLILCVRFSVDGKEWWDSNNGINYNFTFKKAPPRRAVRNSTPPSLGANFASGLHGARHRAASPLGSSGADMNKAFGVPPRSQHSTGPRDWVFPRFSANLMDETPSRVDSPSLSPPPAASFKAPGPPDVHTHLSLSKYCAPSTPVHSPEVRTTRPLEEVTTPEMRSTMNVMGGQLATLAPPEADSDHIRSASWSGSKTGSWESFSKAVEKLDTDGAPGAPAASSDDTSDMSGYESPDTTRVASDGDSTPLAGSRSPVGLPEDGSEGEGSGGSSPVSRPLTLKRSTGNLQALRDAAEQDSTETEEESTPLSSNLSSPPSPRMGLPNTLELGSPSPSASTGDSSPVNTMSMDSSVADLTNLDHDNDPSVERGRSLDLDQRYQELIEKFCFFRSPGATPMEENAYNQPFRNPRTQFSTSGSNSPSGYFYPGNGGPNRNRSPRSTPTPQEYNHEADAFRFLTNIRDEEETFEPRLRSPGAIKIPPGIVEGDGGPGNLTPRASPPSTTGAGGIWRAHDVQQTPSPGLAN
ncbi:putative phosphatase regulatory subunit-domain-containing protein [Kockovaella imperatae]|uniref:Putative phosphatase regulatory subunit-domain-containing protein n=1 Tax=Kockovaella imperatae TaxID=4999 RepID=A0A1Y1UIP5_9TREE|nr:putative phosphatase regulatory subunit-domain-containing protein [Kockovaella imperatae]ORX37920.1 putative phosphatase regulatory subunit-domain-containing protein [Kockovaella imperatae]